ncbi:1-acyl-sn-glycerol-3-phosphate acyltransferase [bacterium]|nr:1-acyl-sn-glycerol-3-phosphate acyltransferase [bacterium]
MAKKEKRNYNKRKASELNFWRGLFQFIVCKIFYMIRLKLIYRLEVHGKENIPKDNCYIVCANHMSTLDPPLIASVLSRPVAFMAKKELFDIKFIRWWLDWLGAFAVDRETLAPSTIKTATEVKKSKWLLGLFPQGTRGQAGVITKVGNGFAGVAKITKCDVLPIGIIGTQKATHIPFSGKIIVNIGEIIPYSENLDEVREKWIKSVEKLTGFSYIDE